jgi:hypothetical protein
MALEPKTGPGGTVGVGRSHWRTEVQAEVALIDPAQCETRACTFMQDSLRRDPKICRFARRLVNLTEFPSRRGARSVAVMPLMAWMVRMQPS